MKNKLWRIWAKSLGQKDGNSDSEADKIAIVRTFIFGITIISLLFNTITNSFIIAGVLRHW